MLTLRDRYFIPESTDGNPVVELRAFTHGLMPRTVPGMMEAFVDDWRLRGVDAWNEVPNHWAPGSSAGVNWWNLPEYLGDTFIAPLLGAPHGTCVMVPHVQWAVSCLLSSDEPFRHGRSEVVCGEMEFPSVLHTVERWTPLQQLWPVILPPGRDGFLEVERLLASISDQTAIVFVSHVGFTSGELIPDEVLQTIARRAARHGAVFCIDGYHAASTMPVNVVQLECDLYVGGLLKEASGSTGNAYVYVREGLQLSPRLSGWFGSADPFAFASRPVDHASVRRRFLGGTTAIAPLYHAVEGLRILLDAGLDRVRDHSLSLTGRAIDRAAEGGMSLRSPSDASRRSAMTILQVEAADQLSSWLKRRGVFTDSRQARYLRMAPFVWNDLGEVDYAFDVLEHALESGEHLSASVAPHRGPVT